MHTEGLEDTSLHSTTKISKDDTKNNKNPFQNTNIIARNN